MRTGTGRTYGVGEGVGTGVSPGTGVGSGVGSGVGAGVSGITKSGSGNRTCSRTSKNTPHASKSVLTAYSSTRTHLRLNSPGL